MKLFDEEDTDKFGTTIKRTGDIVEQIKNEVVKTMNFQTA